MDPSLSFITDISSIPEYVRDQIKHFFEHNKELEKGKYVKVIGWEDKEVAMRKISEAIERYKKELRSKAPWTDHSTSYNLPS